MSKISGNGGSGSGDSKNTLYCSFCGKSQHEVRKLIAGPTVFICDECVELCMDIIREENKTSLVKSGDGVPTPQEIDEVLNDYVIGQSHANDLILTGRGVSGEEARQMGLANRTTEPGRALEEAVELAHEIAGFPGRCTRNDHRSSYLQWDLDLGAALANETDLGLDTITAPEFIDGVVPFLEGKGRGGSFD